MLNERQLFRLIAGFQKQSVKHPVGLSWKVPRCLLKDEKSSLKEVIYTSAWTKAEANILWHVICANVNVYMSDGCNKELIHSHSAFAKTAITA